MLTIERNTRGFHDSLAVRFSIKLKNISLTFSLATRTGQLASLFQSSLQHSRGLISKGREHYLVGLASARQGHVSPFLTAFTVGPRIHRPIVRGFSCWPVMQAQASWQLPTPYSIISTRMMRPWMVKCLIPYRLLIFVLVSLTTWGGRNSQQSLAVEQPLQQQQQQTVLSTKFPSYF